MEAGRAALEPSDHDQVGKRSASPPDAAPDAPPLDREALVRSRHHRLVGGDQPAPSLFAASRKFLTVAVGGLRPSSFSPLRLTQITGTFIFSTGAMSVS